MVLLAMMTISAFLSAFMSNTATASLMCPLAPWRFKNGRCWRITKKSTCLGGPEDGGMVVVVVVVVVVSFFFRLKFSFLQMLLDGFGVWMFFFSRSKGVDVSAENRG